MFPVTELKKVVFPFPAKALKIAVNIKQVDKPIMAKILMHLCPEPDETNTLFSIFFLELLIMIVLSMFFNYADHV